MTFQNPGRNPDRGRFLLPPPMNAAEVPPQTQEKVRLAVGLQEQMPASGTEPSGLTLESRASAAIENEYDEDRIRRHRYALAEYLQEPNGEISLLKLHSAMMEGQPHAQPGRYRTVGVTVGRHRPPRPQQVQGLMDGLFAYMELTDDPLPVQAAWAHLQFETVHPFADGNGRTGRALISRLMGGSLTMSMYIFEKRQEYYNLLDSGEWDTWLEWFLDGTIQECRKAAG